MTKKDYIKIAQVLARERYISQAFPEALAIVDSLASRFCTVLAHDNPRFNRARFLAACRTEQ